MVIELTGVVDVPGPRGAGVPPDPRRALRIVRGADVTVRLRVVRSSGVAYLVAGASLTMTIRKNPRQLPAIFKTAVANPLFGSNVADFTLSPADTKSLTPGTFGWDAWVTDGGARTPVIPYSACVVEPTATEVP